MAHAPLRCLGILGLALGALACDDASDVVVPPYQPGDRFLPEVGDTWEPGVGGSTGSTTEQDPSELAIPGTVTGVAPAGVPGCYSVAVTYEAPWDCSAEQVAEAEVGGTGYAGYDPAFVSGGYSLGAAPPLDAAADVSLAVQSCAELAALRRPALVATYQSALAQNRATVLRARCLDRTSQYWVNAAGDVDPTCEPLRDGASGMGGSAAILMEDTSANEAPSAEEGAAEFSTTNVQVEGVDEPDFVKNDGQTVYVASLDGLHVIDAWPAEQTQEIAHVELPGEPRRLFLAGDRLVVYTRLVTLQSDRGDYVYQSYQDGDCTYGYGCRFSAEAGHTMILVFDVTDPAAPVELVRYELSGAFAAARRVGPNVYTVLQDGGVTALPGLDVTLDADDPDDLEQIYAEKLAALEERVTAVPDAAFLPWIVRYDGDQAQPLDACDDALAGRVAAGTSFVSLLTLDLESLAAPSRSLIASKPGFVYASTSALYLAVDGTDGGDAWYSYSAAANDASAIHKFALDGARTRYVGSRVVRGHVLNQFAMDERDGVLRVATSSGWVPDPEVSSNVLTLGEANGELVELGALTGLAPQEDIRAVRFDGDRAFVVTFKKTDPLFVIDLADPARPSVLGELKIPGFSTYLHRLDAQHLLAVGFDADDHGDFAFFDGIQIQVFDVTDLANPALLHKTVIGTRGSGSEALMNHLAFNYFPPQGLLALPMTICEGGDDGVAGTDLTFSGLMVFEVSLDAGITEVGRMPFVSPAGAAGTSCGTWWTDSTSLVKRSIFMDEFTFGISDGLLNVAATADLGSVLRSVPLVAEP